MPAASIVLNIYSKKNFISCSSEHKHCTIGRGNHFNFHCHENKYWYGNYSFYTQSIFLQNLGKLNNNWSVAE